MHQAEIEDRSRAALGETKSDVLIRNCSLVSVYTGEIIPDTEIAIYKSRISYVGPDASHTTGGDTRIMDAAGRHVAPGLADPHTHIDQFVLPHRTAGNAVRHGTTALFSDPIDITGVGGYEGLLWFADACRDAPARIFNAVPGGVPVDPDMCRAGRLKPDEISSFMERPDVFGMGEVFAWTKVTRRDPDTMRDMAMVQKFGGTINGHTAGMSGPKLASYAAAGIASCHEPINYEQALERLRMGMFVMVREGSIRRDLRRIMEEVISSGIDTGRLMFCTDGLNPPDMASGHMDHCVREAIRAGVEPACAVSMASHNVFRYYRMEHALGGIGVGRLADVVILDDLESFKVNMVLIGGRPPPDAVPGAIPSRLRRTVRLNKVLPSDMALPGRGEEARVNTILLKTEIVTGQGSATLPVRRGAVCATDSIWKVCAVSRDGAQKALAFLEGFGKGAGGMATTATFHDNDIIIIGNDDSDMAAAANVVRESGGGTAVIVRGEVKAHMPLPIAGLMSEEDTDTVAARFGSVREALAEMGCAHAEPHLIPLFLPFLAIPQVRIQSNGMISVRDRKIIPVIEEREPRPDS